MKPNVTQEAQSLREVIKKLLKKNGLNYRDLATELKLTEAAVKKLMKEGDFKIQRLEIIANWFGYTLFELIEMAKRSAITPFTFSNEQEIELSKNPKALYVLLLLAAGFSLEQIKINADMKESEIRRNVFLLDRIQLIKLMPNDKLKMNCRGPFQMNENGPLRKKYLSLFINEIRDLVSTDPQQQEGQIAFELYMSKNLLLEFRNELKEIFNKYSSLARLEKERAQVGDFQAVTGILLAKSQDSWKKVLVK